MIAFGPLEFPCRLMYSCHWLCNICEKHETDTGNVFGNKEQALMAVKPWSRRVAATPQVCGGSHAWPQAVSLREGVCTTALRGVGGQ